MSKFHTPVMLEESISNLIINPSGIYVDATFGGGGHTAGILSRLTPEGRVIAFDRDIDAIHNGVDAEGLIRDSRLTLVHNNFRFVENFVRELVRQEPDAAGIETRIKTGREDGIEAGKVDGILADLGVSSHQFDTAERGFSFRFDAPLDMRMNQEGQKTAADIVNSYSEEDLEKIFATWGEVDNARRVARLIVKARPILRTSDLNKTLEPILPKFLEHKYIAKIYQALRIEVNQEMRSLEKFLDGAARSLKVGGRLVVITYQSLEDRMLKNFIKTGNIHGDLVKDFYGNPVAPLRAVNRKPIVPEEAEIAENTRARSAKLRVAEKVGLERGSEDGMKLKNMEEKGHGRR